MKQATLCFKYTALCFFVVAASLLMRSSALGQTLTWSAPVSNNPSLQPIGGVSGRPGVYPVVFNGKVWVAFTSSQCGSGICYINVANNGGSGTTFGNQSIVPFPDGDYATSNVNPALAVATNNGVQTLYLIFTTSAGQHEIAASNDGYTWSDPNGLIYVPNTVYSPSVAQDPSNPSILYIGYMNGTYYTPVLCTFDTTNPNNQSCQNLTSLRTMNFNPGMVFYDNILYLGFEDRGDSHCLYFYKYTPSTNVFSFWNPLNCGEQTSTAPSLAVYNNDLYVGFRTNDSSQKFTVRISTDGNTLPYRQQPAFKMDGAPALLNAAGTGNTGLFNFYAFNSHLWTSLGH